MIEFKNLTIHFADDPTGEPAVRDISLAISGVVSCFGPNGSGKSTTARWLLGHEPHRFIATSDSPILSGSCAVGYVAQSDRSIMEWRTSLDNIALPWVLQGHRWKHARRAVLDRLDGMLDDVPLTRLGEHLSGGEKRAVMLAREIARDPVPNLLIIDEGFAAMDYERRFRVMAWTRRWCQRVGAAILSIGHDAEEVTLFSDEVAILSPRPGTIAELIRVDGPTDRTIESLGAPWLMESTARVQRGFLNVVKS